MENKIREYENSLRDIIIVSLKEKYGDQFENHYGVSNERLIKWREKRDIEYKKYADNASESRLIYFSDFYDLKTIIEKNWEVFVKIFHSKKRFEIF